MKSKNLAFICFSVLLLLLTFSVQASSQPAQPFPSFPDYSNWPLTNSWTMTGDNDGKTFEVAGNTYQRTDIENLKRYTVNIFRRDNGNLWLGTFFVEGGQWQDNGDILTSDMQAYLFQRNGQDWVFVRIFNLAEMQQGVLIDFLKSRYHLEIKK